MYGDQYGSDEEEVVINIDLGKNNLEENESTDKDSLLGKGGSIDGFEFEEEEEYIVEIERPLLRRPAVIAGLLLGVGCCVLVAGGVGVGLYLLSSLGQTSGEPSSDNSDVSDASIIDLSSGSEHSEVSSISNDPIHSDSYDSGISEPYYIPPVPSAYVDCLQFNTQPPGGSFIQGDSYGDFDCLTQVGNKTEVVPCPTEYKDGDIGCFAQTHTDDKFGFGFNVNDYKGDYRTRLDISNSGDESGFTLDNPDEFSGNMTTPQTNPSQLGSLQTITAFFTNPNKRFVAESAMYEAANTATNAGNPLLSIGLLAGLAGLKLAAPLVTQAFQALTNSSAETDHATKAMTR